MNALDTLADLISGSFWLAPLIALLAGVISSFMPCSLSSVPLVIGYVGGYAGGDLRKAFRYSLVFFLGMTVTFTALGTAASVLGRMVQGTGPWWYIVLGALMVLMALQTWELINIIPQPGVTDKHKRRGYIGAALAGLLGGLLSSPCATPVLVTLLAMVAKEGNLFWGILLLLMYSIGHGVLIIIAGTSIGFVKKVSSSEKYGKINKVFKTVMGILILLLGLYMFYLGF